MTTHAPLSVRLDPVPSAAQNAPPPIRRVCVKSFAPCVLGRGNPRALPAVPRRKPHRAHRRPLFLCQHAVLLRLVQATCHQESAIYGRVWLSSRLPSSACLNRARGAQKWTSLPRFRQYDFKARVQLRDAGLTLASGHFNRFLRPWPTGYRRDEKLEVAARVSSELKRGSWADEK
jgi:hypothetical protein